MINSSKKSLIIYLVLTFGLTGLILSLILGGMNYLPLIGNIRISLGWCLMWTPGIVGIICSLLSGNRLKDLGLGQFSIKWGLISYLIPLIVTLITFSLLLIFKISQFNINPDIVAAKGGADKALTWLLLIVPTISLDYTTSLCFLFSFFLGLGEEIGWRGFLHTWFKERGIHYRYVITGVIWGVWHWPDIILGLFPEGTPLAWSLVTFTLLTIFMSIFMGRIRDLSNSVWPAAITHGAHNTLLLWVMPSLLKNGPLTPYLSGECGVFTIGIYATIAWLSLRNFKLFPLRKQATA